MAAGRALDRLGHERGLGDGTAVVDAACTGDADAVDCLRILGERLGVGIANCILYLRPRARRHRRRRVARRRAAARARARESPRASSSRASAPRPASSSRATAPRPACAAPRCSPSSSSRSTAGPRRRSCRLASARRVRGTSPSREPDQENGETMATQQVNERLAALTAAGTSVWLDQIRRSLIDGGELERLVEEDSLRGVTSNPTIFEKAILGSDGLRRAARASWPREGADAAAIYQELAIRDVQDGVRRPARRSTTTTDGARRLRLARGRPRPRASTPSARWSRRASYWERVDRPNLMIKIPGTEEGVPAIEEMIYEGHQHQRHAALRASRRTRRSPRPTSAGSSAASRRASRSTSTPSRRFFVSRVDTEVDKRLEALGPRGAAWAAPASPTRAPPTSASRRSSAASASPRCATPARAVQRPLWASTGVKNPQLPRHDVRRRRSSRPTPSTRCRWRRCSPPPTTREVDGRRPPTRTRRADLQALGRRGHRHRAT